MRTISIVAPIFAIIGVGYFFKRKNFFSEATMRELNRFLFWIAMPALLMRSIFGANMSSLGNLVLPVVMNISFIVMPFIGWAVGRARKEHPARLAVTIMASVRCNQVFIGIPLAGLAFGGPGLEFAAVYLAFSLIPFQIASIAGAQFALEGDFSWKSLLNTLKTLLSNPLFMSCFLALSLSAFGLNDIPKWAETILKILGDVGTGMALVMVGTEIKFKGLIRKLKNIGGVIFLKLIIQPLITYLSLSLCGAPTILIQVATLATSTPVAPNALILAKSMKLDAEYMVDIVLTTTILSMFTMSFWIYILS